MFGSSESLVGLCTFFFTQVAVAGKYQDNLEFMQWFKGFCNKHEVIFALKIENGFMWQLRAVNKKASICAVR